MNCFSPKSEGAESMTLWLKQWGVCQCLASTINERVSSGGLRRMLLHFLGFCGGQPFVSERGCSRRRRGGSVVIIARTAASCGRDEESRRVEFVYRFSWLEGQVCQQCCTVLMGGGGKANAWRRAAFPQRGPSSTRRLTVQVT